MHLDAGAGWGQCRWCRPRPSRGWLAGAGLILAATAEPALAQRDSATIRVRVESAAGALATARVEAGQASIHTTREGAGTLRVPAGEFELRVARIGYLPARQLLVLTGGTDTTVVVALQRAPDELEDLVVGVTRSGRRLADLAVRVEVLGTEEIEEKVLMTPGDIAMLLNETGGLRVQNTSPSLGGANVRVQGLRGRYTLLLSDGLPLHGEQAGGPGLLQVPPLDLGQVEVLKGAASAMHGSAALGGVVNLLSRRPDGERLALANVTSAGGSDLASWVSGVISPDWGWSLTGGWHRQDRIDRDGDGWTDMPGYQRGVVRSRLYYEDARGQSFYATTGATIEARRGGTIPGAAAPAGGAWPERGETRRLDAGLVGQFAAGEGSFLAVRGSVVTLRHEHRFGAVVEPDHHLTGFAELALVRPTGPATVVAGVAWQGDRFRSEAAPRFDFGVSVPALFAQVDWDPAEALSLSASARLDRHSEYGTFVSPRLSALGRPGDAWTVRASAGGGYFGPTPLVEATEVTGLSGVVQPAPLVAERAIGGSADLGFRHGAIELNATLFGSRIRHPVAVVDERTTDGDDQVLRNLDGPVRTWGAELLARIHREGLHLTASYTWLRATEQVPDAPAARREVPLTPRHALGVVGMREWGEETRLGIEVYYTGRQALEDNPFRDRSPGFFIVGALVERQVGVARLFLNLENLTGTRQTRTDPLVRPTPGAGGRWTTDAWAPLEGRVINGGVKVSW